jgi:cytoskeletal protein RodZ
MGKEVRGLPAAAPLAEAGAPASDQRIGSYLAAQRRLRGISLDDLASLTRIPRRSLERLEGGAFDGSPDGFSRGFVRTVAAALGLDPEDAVMRLMAEPAADAAAARSARRAQRLRIAGAAALVLALLGTLALLRLAALRLSDGEPPAEHETLRRRDAVREFADDAGRAAREAEPAPAP